MNTLVMTPTSNGLAANLTAMVKEHLASVEADLVDAARSAEDQVSAAIDECLLNVHGPDCQPANPHECPKVALAILTADAAMEMLAVWLIAEGRYSNEDDAYEAAFELVADAAARRATALEGC